MEVSPRQLARWAPSAPPGRRRRRGSNGSAPSGSPSDIGAYGGPGADRWDLDGDGYPSWWQPGPYDFSTYPGLGWDCDDLDAGIYPGNGC